MKTWTEICHTPTGMPLYRVLLELDGRTYRYRLRYADWADARAVMLRWRTANTWSEFGSRIPYNGAPVDSTGEWIPTEE